MLGHGGSSAGSYLADPTSPNPLALCCNYPFSKCPSASKIVVTSTVRVNGTLPWEAIAYTRKSFNISVRKIYLRAIRHGTVSQGFLLKCVHVV